jgi:hypothetical protein
LLELLIDNDVVIKFAEYRLLDDLGHFGCSAGCANEAGLLGAVRFVGAKRLKRRVLGGALDAQVLTEFASYVAGTAALEPSAEELALSAELEEWALLNGAPLDSGESQLLGIATLRGGVVLTGDKRAIASAQQALPIVPWLSGIAGEVACLEQAINAVVARRGPENVRESVCAAIDSDRALTLAFSCSLRERSFDPTGLASYIDAIRIRAPTLLRPGYELVL